jgi:general secretion pathway protein J
MKRTIITCEPIAFLRSKPPLLTAKHNNLRRSSGFTLLEILIAMFILAIVVSLVFASFDGIFSSAEHVTADSDLLEMGSVCLNRITTDLKAFHATPYPRYKPPEINDDPELYYIAGEPLTVGGHNVAKLRFASLAHLPLNQEARTGIAEIVYYALECQDNGVCLHRADTLYPYPDFEPNPNDPVMCEQVLTFELTYYDHDGRARDEWNSESQDSDYSTPIAIGIKLVLGPEASPKTLTTRVTLPTFRYKAKDS